MAVRIQVASYIKSNRELFEPYVGDAHEFDEYLDHMLMYVCRAAIPPHVDTTT